MEAGRAFLLPGDSMGDNTTKTGQRITCSIPFELTSTDKEGKEFDVTAIRGGKSLNGAFFWEQSAIKDFRAILANGKKIPVHLNHQSEEERKKFGVRDVRLKVGWIEGDKGDDNTVRSRFKVVDPVWRVRLKNAADMDNPEFYEMSVVTWNETESNDGVLHLHTVQKWESIDLVSEGEAFGTVDRLVASAQKPEPEATEEHIMADNKDAKLKDDVLEEGAVVEETTEVEEAADETPDEKVEQAAAPAPKPAPKKEKPLTVFDADGAIEKVEAAASAVETRLQEAETRLQMAQCKTAVTETLATVPKAVGEELMAKYGKAEKPFDLEHMHADVKTWTKMHDAGNTAFGGIVTTIEPGKDHLDKCKKALEGYMMGGFTVDDIQPFSNIRQAYAETTGDHRGAESPATMLFMSRGWVSSVIRNDHRHPMHDLLMHRQAAVRQAQTREVRQSVTTSQWAEVFGDVRYNMLVRGYMEPDHQQWRKLVSQYGAHDSFETHHITRTGSYSTVPTVSEGATYQDFTTPGDEEVTVALQKYGSLENITEEAFRADKIGAIGRNRMGYGRAMARTMDNAFFDMFKNNSTIYDSNNLGDSTNHGSNNYGTAFSLASWKEIKKIMRDQTEYGNTSAYLGVRNLPKFFIGANELDESSAEIFQKISPYEPGSGDFTVNTIAQITNPGVERIIRDDWISPTMYWAVADPAKTDTVYAAFLDGIQQPQMFTSDDPTGGSMLYSDKIVDKIRHAWKFAVLDFRSFVYGSS